MVKENTDMNEEKIEKQEEERIKKRERKKRPKMKMSGKGMKRKLVH